MVHMVCDENSQVGAKWKQSTAHTHQAIETKTLHDQNMFFSSEDSSAWSVSHLLSPVQESVERLAGAPARYRRLLAN